MTSEKMNIAIDGPAAGGKTTVARLVASELGLLYLDTGMMYRALAWQALQDNVPLDDTEALGKLAEELPLDLEAAPDTEAGCRVYVNGVDITAQLHGDQVSAAVSKVASVSAVRADMVKRQQKIAEAGGVVMAGRDICTVVLPKAELQYYLDASLDERAKRRFADMQARSGNDLTYADVRQRLAQRDYEDTHRADSPLKQAERAKYIDCTHLSAAQVSSILVDDYRKLAAEKAEEANSVKP